MRSGLLIVSSTLLSYILFELGFYLALCFGLAMPVHPYYTYSVWTNSRFIAADPLIGIRLQPNQPNDGIRIVRGDVQFYYPGETANAAGFHSDHEYFPQKKRPYRIVVYGSSFVAMLYQTGNWVDHLNDILEKEGIEVYNFSFDGGALPNWHAHYFRELTKRYDFDMVVLAMRADDITSWFIVSETRPDGYFIGGFRQPPRDIADLDENYRPKLHRIIGMTDPEFVASLNEHFTHHKFLLLPPDLYALKSLRLAVFGNPPEPAQQAPEEANPRALLDEMLSDIRRRGKKAVLVALPMDRGSAAEAPAPDIQQLHAVAASSCIDFIDGNDLFWKFLTPADIANYWPRYEGHWLKRGGDRFADFLAPALVRERETSAKLTSACR
jgi:hypothetical protein